MKDCGERSWSRARDPALIKDLVQLLCTGAAGLTLRRRGVCSGAVVMASLFLFSFAVLGIKLRVSCILSEYSASLTPVY